MTVQECDKVCREVQCVLTYQLGRNDDGVSLKSVIEINKLQRSCTWKHNDFFFSDKITFSIC